jgi:tRNA pseudouridine55 synthase
MASDGLLIIDKPAGLTSHDVVQVVRRLLGVRRAGHGGTLDPDATGVLLVALGQATRFFPFLAREFKVYEGRIRLGFATDTYDASGRPAAEECRNLPALADVEAAMKTFEGEILQTPPRFSAKKIHGRPVYKLARADREFSLTPSSVTVVRFILRDFRPPYVDFETECSAGTYVRSLAHDLGQRLGCGAHLAALRRTSVGLYGLADAVSLAGLAEAAALSEATEHILPLERLLPGAPAVTVLPAAELKVRNGSVIEPAQLEIPPGSSAFSGGTRVVRLFSRSGKFLALARPLSDEAGLHPFLVIS